MTFGRIYYFLFNIDRIFLFGDIMWRYWIRYNLIESQTRRHESLEKYEYSLLLLAIYEVLQMGIKRQKGKSALRSGLGSEPGSS